MIARLLQLRFKEGEVKRRLDSADTKTKISLAWQNLASILSQDLEKVISREQVGIWIVEFNFFILFQAYQKYRKLKSMYMKEKRDSKKTGNDCSMQVLDEPLWVILNDAFAKKEGISGDVLADTNVDSDEDASDKETGVSESNDGPSPGKLPPVTQLAHAMENGMTAIATAMGTRPSSDDNFRALTAALEKQTHAIDEQRREARHLQELQLQLLRRLLEKKD
ncbi:hypothetical protein PHMEG_00012867 [Phytophthora megakarya]|uniref:Uncharacterized protein n=1 Tax=Phytophthora megakarya TaxID=4795 RepID=A0A225W7N7_9STRA|nr:hypothetical protein PHMEG_00012867 [Phytophthora megakarya]